MSDKIILNSKAEPFATEAAAKADLKRRELDIATHKVVKHAGGWAIERPDLDAPGGPTQEGTPQASGETPKQTDALPPDRIYKRVTFQQKQSESEQDNVELWLNGSAMVFKRGEPVITTLAHLEVADHTTRPIHVVRAGMGRKVVAHTKMFPYQVHGDATEADYVAFRASALKLAKAAGEAGAAA
ncbi:MAG: hypothetical protein KJ579_01020 [Verrucomicrobia bacterium]|nr:hypothetical protein [Verrucomicrobiota bacterium]